MADTRWQKVLLQETDSTMLHARRLIEEGAISSPFFVLAESQSGGRGRQGRQWSSAAGGFYATYVMEVHKSPEHVGGFSLAVGSIIADVLEDSCPAIRLKWPNDLLISDGRKLGGILIETLVRNGATVVLIGIGINFDNQIDTDMMTSVREFGANDLTIADLSSQLAHELERGMRSFLDDGLSSFLPRWNERDYLRGKQVNIDCGEREVSGRVTGVAQSGALQLESRSGREEIWSGHITVIEG